MYLHNNHNYENKKINFHEHSFKVAGISFNQNIADKITYQCELYMKNDINNPFDVNAIGIYNDEHLLGYVPKEFINCIQEYMVNNNKLKVINIKEVKHPNKHRGIRVIPEDIFEESMINDAIFGDDNA